MTRDEIIKLARAVGWDEMGADLWGAAFDGAMSIHALERFAALVAAAEREACAKVCDDNADCCYPGSVLHSILGANAAAIRARSQV